MIPDFDVIARADEEPMDLVREVVALLRALDDFEKPLRAGEAWWESPEYQALMDRKAELVQRCGAALDADRSQADGD